MNWFNILKNTGLAQRQRQGISSRQKDEDFVFEDEDSTCRDKLIELYQKALNSFPDGKRKDVRGGSDEHYDLKMSHIFEYEGGEVVIGIKIPNEGVLPDDVYCRILNAFERKEKAGPSDSQNFMEYQYIDYNLKETKLVIGDTVVDNTKADDRYGIAQLGFYTYINDSPDLHPGQTIQFYVLSEFKDKTIKEGVSAYTGSPILRHKTFRDIKTWRGLF